MWEKLKRAAFGFLSLFLLRAYSMPQDTLLQVLPHSAEIAEFGHERKRLSFRKMWMVMAGRRLS